MALSMLLAVLCVMAAVVLPTLALSPEPLLVAPRVAATSLYTFSSLRAPASGMTTFRYYFQKQNLDWLETQFTAISDPKSASYRKFLNKSTIDAMLLPGKSVTAPVYDFFQSHGIPLSNLTQKDAILYVTAPVPVVERIFNISLYVYPRQPVTGPASTTPNGPRPLSNSSRAQRGVGAAILRSPNQLTVPAAITAPLWFILGLNDVPPQVAGKNFTKLSQGLKAPSKKR